MAIDSIGPKLMVQSAAELAKDTSVMQKRPEMQITANVQQVQAEADRMTQEIMDIYEPDAAIIHRERERQKRQKNEQDEENQEEGSSEDTKKQEPLRAGAEYKRIDIRV